MAGIDSQIFSRVALHHERKIVGPIKAEKITLDNRGPKIAEEALKIANPTERQSAFANLWSIVDSEAKKYPVFNRPVKDIDALRTIADEYNSGNFPLSGANLKSAEQLAGLYQDLVDGVAVATVVKLSGDPVVATMIQGHSGAEVEIALGTNLEMKGIGDVIKDSAILDKRLRNRLGVIQKKIEGGGFDLQEMAKSADLIADDLIEGKVVNEDEAQMVLAYLSSIIGAEKEELRVAEVTRQQVDQRRDAALSAQEEQARRQNELNAVLEETSKEIFYDAVISHSESVSVPGAIWALEPPADYVGSKAEWNFFLMDVAGMHNKAFKRKGMLSSTRDLAHEYFNPEYPKVMEKSLAALYEDRRSGFRDGLMEVVKDLFVETITEQVNGELVIRPITEDEIKRNIKGQFVMNYDIPGVNGEGGEAFRDGGRMAYLKRAAEIVNRGNNPPKDIEFVMMQVTQALNFLELGDAFDTGDHKRKCPDDTVEAVRTTARPGYKFGDKTEGGEVFSASWQSFFTERYKDNIASELEGARRSFVNGGGVWNEKLAKEAELKIIVKMARKMEIMPTVLCESILDKEFVVGYEPIRGTDRKKEIKMSLGRAMQSGTDIILNRSSEKDPDEPAMAVGNLIFSIGKNRENAVAFWDIFSGKEELTFKGELTEIDSVIKKFTGQLNNAYDFLGPDGKGLVNIKMLYGAIGGAAGLVPSEPIILDVGLDAEHGQTYSFVGESILSQFSSLTTSEKAKLRNLLAVDHPLANSLKKWWINSKNGRLSSSQRDSWRRRLQKSPNMTMYERDIYRLGK